MINTYHVYHPLRALNSGEDYAEIVQAKDITLIDINKKEYRDYISGLWNIPLGYSDEKIKKSIRLQLDKLPYVNLFNLGSESAKILAEKLYEITDGEYVKTIYTCTGSESVEVGVKIAHKYQYSKKNYNKVNIAVFDMSYHGTYYASMSASGMDIDYITHGYGEILNNFRYIKTPICKCCRSDNLSDKCKKEFMNNLREFMEENKDTLAAFILEPILGSAGVIKVPEEYIREIKRYCDENDILLIFDEVATGFCRTGKTFAYEHYDIRPDVLLLSKGINNGYIPMGVTLINSRVLDILGENDDIFIHLSTQNGNPLACASAISTIEELYSGKFNDVVNKKGILFEDILKNKLSRYPSVFEIRRFGFMFAIELSKSRFERIKLEDQKIEKLIKRLLSRGTIIYGYYTKISSGFTLMPSYITTEEEWLKGVNDIENAIKRLSIV